MYYGASAALFAYAKEMRKKPTKAEEALWQILKEKQFAQYKFRRQHPIARFIADFYCHSLRLVIEVDGGYHLEQEQKIFDSFRDEDMNALGISVLRLTNEEVLHNIEDAKSKLFETISVLPPYP